MDDTVIITAGKSIEENTARFNRIQTKSIPGLKSGALNQMSCRYITN